VIKNIHGTPRYPLGAHNGLALLGRQADKYAHPQNQDLVGVGVNRIGKEQRKVVDHGHVQRPVLIERSLVQTARAGEIAT
jgi:hypothetical protein